jgi:hypothetical protein
MVRVTRDEARKHGNLIGFILRDGSARLLRMTAKNGANRNVCQGSQILG